MHGEIPPACMPEFFATALSLFPELRALSIQLKPIPMSPVQLPSDDQEPDDDEEGFYEEGEYEVEERMVELWEGESDFDVIDNDSDIDDALPAMPAEVTPVEFPGHMYRMSYSCTLPLLVDIHITLHVILSFLFLERSERCAFPAAALHAASQYTEGFRYRLHMRRSPSLARAPSSLASRARRARLRGPSLRYAGA
ncbi:hypothetical protein C8R44DRAFT_753657 [Mycena epipterygia]|nr:hypothetical protein C8R44DRAFT_753657 [Mycena epipterygia]